jgi:dTMP kinase
MAFLNGITLLGVEIEDAMRGRVYSFIQVSVQGVLLLTLSASSVLVGIGSSRLLSVGPVAVSISSTRVLLLAAGVVGVFAGFAALRQMDDKRGVPLLADLISSIRGRPLGRPEPPEGSGLFVVFEGGEGAGKSTQVIKLAAWLRVHGNEAVVTREPGATEVGARIRGLVLDAGETTVSPRAEALLYAADRAHHVATVVRPALQRGAVVVSDRYVDSSLAYQGAGRTLPPEEIGWLSNWATGGLRPNLVVLLDIDPNIGLARAAARSAADKLEAESILFHERVRQAFLDLAERDPARYLVLDATLDQEQLAERVRERVSRLLKLADADSGSGSGSGSGSASGPGSGAGAAAGSGAAADGVATAPDAAVPTARRPASSGSEPMGTEYGRIEPTVAGETTGEEGAAPKRADETSVLPRLADETAVLPRVTGQGAAAPKKAAETGGSPKVADAAVPATGPDGTTVLPAVSEPSDPWRSSTETAVFPAITPGFDPWEQQPAPPEPGPDDETMIMPSRTGDLRRRRPRRER